MHEGMLLEDITFTREQFGAMDALGVAALKHVDREFGTGYPHFSGGKRGGLAYHNGHHTRAVREGAIRFCQDVGCSPTETKTAEVAADEHDSVQLKSRGVMERESADRYERGLRKYRLPEPSIIAGRLAILGTEPIMQGNRVVGQMVSRLHFPSKAAERVAMGVACADFGELYMPLAPYLSHRLWQEIKGTAPNKTLPMESFVAFQTGQAALHQNYRYPHPRGERLFGRLRGPVTTYQEKVLRQTEAGTLESFDQLLKQDLAFAAKLS